MSEEEGVPSWVRELHVDLKRSAEDYDIFHEQSSVKDRASFSLELNGELTIRRIII